MKKFYSIILAGIFTLLHSAPCMGQGAKCLDFGGTNDYVDLGDMGSFNDFTIETWFKHAGLFNYENLFHTNDGAGNLGVRLEITQDANEGHLYVAISGDGSFNPYTVVPLGAPLDKSWHHIAIVGDRSHDLLKIYLDGMLIVNTPHNNWPNNFPEFVLGRGASMNAENDFKGRLDELRIWNTVRTEQEIGGNRFIELSGSEAGLMSYYNFNQGNHNKDNTAITDLIDNGPNHQGGKLKNFVLNDISSNFTGPGFQMTTLPVDFSQFRSLLKNGAVYLYWVTESEKDNQRFEIEESTDGIHYTMIGQVKGKGTVSFRSEYDFRLAGPLTGKKYYRLLQVDIDGLFDYSKVIAIDFSNETSLVGDLYPNPAAPGLVKLDYHSSNKDVLSVLVYNNTGQVVLKKAIAVKEGANTLALDLSSLKAGSFSLQLQGVKSSTSRKLIVL